MRIFVCVYNIEVGSFYAARNRILRDSMAPAVFMAEHPGPSGALQLLRGYLFHHCWHRQLCHLLLQRPGHQSATLRPHQMVNTVSCRWTDLLQQSNCGGFGYNRSPGRDNITRSTPVLYAWHSVICYELLVRIWCRKVCTVCLFTDLMIFETNYFVLFALWSVFLVCVTWCLYCCCTSVYPSITFVTMSQWLQVWSCFHQTL